MLLDFPDRRHRGPWPELTADQGFLSQRLQEHVRHLSHVIGPRNYKFYDALNLAVGYLKGELNELGYQVRELCYEADGQLFANLETISEGPSLLVGAHYDSVLGCPGANDNASGVAGVLELARLLRGQAGLQFALFANEEPPFYKTQYMGSEVYASQVERSQIRGMVCLETVGYYTQAPKSQRTAFPGMLPSVGDFVAVVGDWQSADLVGRLVKNWQAPFSCLGLAPTSAGEPSLMQAGMGMSDHACFWERGIPAVMVTDTVFYRYDHYHLPTDTWEKLTYDPFARMIEGLADTLRAYF